MIGIAAPARDRRTERLVERPREKACHGVYLGLAHFLTDRIFLTDYESLTGLEMTQTILFPSFKNRVTRLTGLKLGVSGSGERMPCCARVAHCRRRIPMPRPWCCLLRDRRRVPRAWRSPRAGCSPG